jgi:predicted  nucleic acid-binding Zn-ribbon protein
MSNQWGRDQQVTRGRGSSGLLLPAVLCVALIAAGGYFWFARQNMQADIAALRSEATSLTAELAKVTAEKDKASNDLVNLKKNSGNWAEELEKDYADLKLNEIPKLNRLLDKRDADIAALEKLLVTEKTASKSDADDFTATIAGLNEQLSTAKTASTDARTEAQKLGADKLALNKQITGLKAALQRAMADTVAAQKALEQKIAEAEKKPATSKSALDLARDAQIQTLEQSLGEERQKVTALQKRLEDQAAAADRMTAQTPSDMPVIDKTISETSQPAPGIGLLPRDRQMVDSIIGTTRGVGFLDDEKKQRLKDQLASGACVTDALESVFDKVPLILMRNLMRDFKSDC